MPCKCGPVFALYLHDWTLYGINTVQKTGPYLHGIFPVIARYWLFQSLSALISFYSRIANLEREILYLT